MNTANRQQILVVDDVPQNIDVLANILSPTYQVKAALNGERALAIARSNPSPDLVLLDIAMPGMDGYEVCHRLKEQENTREIPVIFVSALSDEKDETHGLALGAVDYIAKPVSPPIVAARVANHLLIHNQKRRIESALAELQKLEQLKDDLAHMIIHDMRSPLTVIILGLECIKQIMPSGIDDKNLKFALGEAEKLNQMVEALLDVSRLESGKMPLHPVRHDLLKVAQDAVSANLGLAEAQMVRLSLKGDSSVAEFDEKLVYRVFANLIGNAIKFSPEKSGIEIHVRSLAGGVSASVSDFGPGISEEYRQRIFEKFSQIEARQNNEQHSTGLGLTFCKLAVEAHGGRIGVKSEVGIGSTFWFSLPQTCLTGESLN